MARKPKPEAEAEAAQAAPARYRGAQTIAREEERAALKAQKLQAAQGRRAAIDAAEAARVSDGASVPRSRLTNPADWPGWMKGEQ
jgi:hypothetical protein